MKDKFLSVAGRVEDYLTLYFDEFTGSGPPGIFLPFPDMNITDEVVDLTLRGGKRVRAALLVCGYELFKQDALLNSSVLRTAAAIELLQTYFLIHDDIMDEDLSRRGGKSVHCSLHAKTGSARRGRDLAILAGDLANGMAASLMAAPAPVSECQGCMDRARELFSRMHLEVIAGQVMDLQNGDPAETVIRKTASYTCVGPLCAGALLGGADDVTVKQIAAAGQALGTAFQYRDDLIGLFGDREETGKPLGSDLKNSKNTFVINLALAGASSARKMVINQVLGNRNATDAQVKAALEAITDTGAVTECENNIISLTDSAMERLDSFDKQNEGLMFFNWIAKRLVDRNS
jgi:geranylgeranyl diphosphate synthase type I